jgi:diaminohydroxyphosphoribosylaminopyrimidine deaminase/5-amino-6-(5-phosphoribosylamino)uracil reductase
MQQTTHEQYMKIAIAYAKRGSGTTCPNPSVGCVIVKNGRIIAAATTSESGRPHAEVNALNSAIESVTGATAYVTLEPCSHTGKTGPCANALIDAGIKCVVIACVDPNPLVSGEGILRLREHGVEVITGILEHEARQVHAPFFKRIVTGRPLVTIKMAQTIDGKIGIIGRKYVLSGKESHAYAHYLRARNEAILVGVETVLVDNPMLNCRLKGLETASPVRVVLDTNLRITADCKLIKTADKYKTIIITASEEEKQLGEATIIRVGRNKFGRASIKQMLDELGKLGINSLLVEGGAKVATAFIRNRLADRLEIVTTPKILGGNSISGIALKTKNFENSFKFIKCQRLGADVLNIYEKV